MMHHTCARTCRKNPGWRHPSPPWAATGRGRNGEQASDNRTVRGYPFVRGIHLLSDDELRRRQKEAAQQPEGEGVGG